MLNVEIFPDYGEAVDQTIHPVQGFLLCDFGENAVAYKLSVLTDANIFEININIRIAYIAKL